MMSEADVKEVMAFLSVDECYARHYLKQFGEDKQRTVNAYFQNGADPDWWAHPRGNDEDWSSEPLCEQKQMDNAEEEANYRSSFFNEEQEAFDSTDEVGAAFSEQDELVFEPHQLPDRAMVYKEEDDSSELDGGLFIEERVLKNDKEFYKRYPDLVDSFVDAVCSKSPRSELRKFIDRSNMTVYRNSNYAWKDSDLVNRLSFKHEMECGRSPLAYAVAKNLEQMVYDLIDLGANVSKKMPQCEDDESPEELDTPVTALVIAATNQKRDGSEMVRILLSKGAKPVELEAAGVKEKDLNRAMRYWIDKARRVGIPPEESLKHMAKMPPMDRLHELDYAVVGEEACISTIQEALAARFGNPQGSRKPLVMVFLGPPGHGKTYFSSNAARSLVGEDNFLFVPCQSIRDDADLFGSRLGGSRGGEYSSDGQLTSWLRARQGQKCIVFLDEFEKMKDLTSSLGWGQAKKIYQSFLEPWNDGTLSDQGALSGGYNAGRSAATSAGGNKIDCSQVVWILTSNWGQQDIIEFSEIHKDRVQKNIQEKDVAWIQKELIKKILRPLVMREFASVHEDLRALCRRIDLICPFLPFTKAERKVVADIAVRARFSLYREPCKLDGPEKDRRLFGNLFLHSTRAFTDYAAESYEPMQGASSMLSLAQQADGKFQMMSGKGRLGLTPAQENRVTSTKPAADLDEEPHFWAHYDKESEEISITQSRPADDEEDSDGEEETTEEGFKVDEQFKHDHDDGTLSISVPRKTNGAADDAF